MQFQILPDPATATASASVAAFNDCSCQSFAKQLWLKDKAGVAATATAAAAEDLVMEICFQVKRCQPL